MAKILFGKPVGEKIKEKLVKTLSLTKHKPSLLIIQIGNREDSNIYIKNKIDFGRGVGIDVHLKKFNKTISQNNLEKNILKLIKENYSGIIIQLPLPEHLDTEKILALIPKEKDADGLSSKKNDDYLNVVTPATAKAVLSLLNYYKIKVKNRKIVVLGKSKLAGQAIFDLLKSKGALIYSFDKNSDTKRVKSFSKKSDILISAIGNPNFIDKDYVNKNQTIIDVGINRINLDNSLQKKITGDVYFDEVSKIVKAITPVPGGIGPLTVACLFENLLEL